MSESRPITRDLKPLSRALIATVLAALLAQLPWLEGGASPTGLFVTHTLVLLLVALSLLRSRQEGGVVLGVGWEAPAGLAALMTCCVSFLAVDYLYGPFLSLWNTIMAVALAAALLMIGDTLHSTSANVVAVSSVAQALAVFVMPVPKNMTPSASFANANQLCAYLNIGTFVAVGIALGAWRERARWRAGAATAIALVNTIALLRVGARGALAALLLGGFAILLSAPRSARAPRLVLWGVLAALAVSAAMAVAWRFERIGDPYRFDRVRIWKMAVDATREHPVLGIGPGMFERRAYRYNFPLDREMFRYSKMSGSTHNTYLQMLAETGILGFIGWMSLIAALAGRVWKVRRAAPGPALALLACLVQGLVDTPFDAPAVTLSLVALVIPLLGTREARNAPIFLALSWRRGAAALPVWATLAGALAPAWLGGVLLPYAARTEYLNGRIDTAIRLDAYNPLYRASRAEMTWRRDRPLDPSTFAAADLDLEEASRLDPGDPDYLLRLAQLHARACFEIGADPAALARADELYRRAIGLGIKDPRPHFELATFLLAQGRAEEGIGEIRAALALEPRFLAARLALVKALLDEGRREEAAGELARLQETRVPLRSYVARNGYEEDLMRIESGLLADVESKLR